MLGALASGSWAFAAFSIPIIVFGVILIVRDTRSTP
jgi:hypothetical protein